MGKNNGFTMLELMVAIAICAVLSAVAVPNMIGWISNRRIQSSANDLNAAFHLARTTAIRENADVVIALNLAGDACEIFVDDGAGGSGTPQNQIRDGSEAIVDRIALPAGVDMYERTFTGSWCGYTSRGIPIDDNFGQIHMRNSADRYMGIGLNMAGNPSIIESHDNGGTWN